MSDEEDDDETKHRRGPSVFTDNIEGLFHDVESTAHPVSREYVRTRQAELGEWDQLDHLEIPMHRRQIHNLRKAIPAKRRVRSRDEGTTTTAINNRIKKPPVPPKPKLLHQALADQPPEVTRVRNQGPRLTPEQVEVRKLILERREFEPQENRKVLSPVTFRASHGSRPCSAKRRPASALGLRGRASPLAVNLISNCAAYHLDVGEEEEEKAMVQDGSSNSTRRFPHLKTTMSALNELEAASNELWAAIHFGDIGAARLCLDRIPRVVNHPDEASEARFTPLIACVRHMKEDFVALLISRRGDPNAIDRNGWGSLHHSAQVGNIKITRALITAGAQAERKTLEGRTALLISVREGYGDMAEILLEARASAQTVTASKWGALHVAAYCPGEDGSRLVRALLLANAQPEEVTNKKHTPLHLAALRGRVDVIVRLLSASGTRVNAIDDEGNTALHYCASKGHESPLESILKAKADIHATNKRGEMPIHLAAFSGSVHVTNLLLDAKAQLEVESSDKYTPLHFAATSSGVITKLLLEHAAIVNCREFHARTPFHLAALNGNVEAMEVLLEHGAMLDATAQIRSGHHALHMAATEGKGEAVRFLLDSKADPDVADGLEQTALHFAALRGHADVVRLLVEGGADLEAHDNSSWRAVHFAAVSGATLCMQQLRTLGAVTDSKGGTDCTTLHIAARMGHFRLVEDLVRLGMKVDAQDIDHATPIMLAAGAGHTEVVRFLVSAGGDASSTDRVGWNAFFYAAYGGFVHTIELLSDLGGDMLSRAIDKRTVLHVAVQGLGMDGEGYEPLVEALVEMMPSDFINEKDETKHTALSYARHYERGSKVLAMLKYEEEATLDGAHLATVRERDRRNKEEVRRLISAVFQQKKKEMEQKEQMVIRMKLQQDGNVSTEGASGLQAQP